MSVTPPYSVSGSAMNLRKCVSTAVFWRRSRASQERVDAVSSSVPLEMTSAANRPGVTIPPSRRYTRLMTRKKAHALSEIRLAKAYRFASLVACSRSVRTVWARDLHFFAIYPTDRKICSSYSGFFPDSRSFIASSRRPLSVSSSSSSA